MEPVTLVATALIAGASAGASGVATQVVKDAYEALKALVVRRFQRRGVAGTQAQELISQAGQDKAKREELERELAAAEVDEPTLKAAQDLLDRLGVKYQVDASQAKGVYIGDHGVQNNNFN